MTEQRPVPTIPADLDSMSPVAAWKLLVRDDAGNAIGLES